MDTVYAPRTRDTTKVVNISQKFDAYKKNLFPRNLKVVPLNDEEIKEAVSFDGTDEEFEKLLESVSIERHLSFDDDVEIKPYDITTPNKKTCISELPSEAMKLKVIQNTTRTNDLIGRKSCLLKYNKNIFLQIPDPTESLDLVVYNEILITIRFYFPFKHKFGQGSLKPNQFAEEFLVLGSQYLSELRDKIHCKNNHGPFFDISQGPKASAAVKQHDSGFLFIHDTFYNDTRNPNNMDYSEVIRNWYQKRSVNMGFKVLKMEETKFSDLRFRMGYPQVYQHHGNCEHLFCISDVRLLSLTDCLVREKYPILSSIANIRYCSCFICGQNHASYVVKNCLLLIHDPTLLCLHCYNSYLFTDGKKVCDFQSYPYHENDFHSE